MTSGICVVLAVLAWLLATSGAAVWYGHALTSIEQQGRRPERRHRWDGQHAGPR
jgi:hypothetical protein